MTGGKRPIDFAKDDLGTWEWADGHNPKVVQYFANVGHSWVKDDETAWCAAFVGAMLKKAGIPHTGKLNARSYLDWGDPVSVEDFEPGDVVVFSRGDPKGWQGHVGFVEAINGQSVHVLGGNQGNQVSSKIYPMSRLLGIRRHPMMDKPERGPIIHPLPEEQPQGFWAALIAMLFGGRK